MSLWGIKYHPPKGERNSPVDIIVSIPDNNNARTKIVRWLEFMCQHSLEDWLNVKNITGKIWQLRAGSYRVYYFLDGRDIVVVHCCRKKGKKALRKDLQRAELNYDDYFASKE